MGCCYSEFHALCDRQTTHIYIYVMPECHGHVFISGHQHLRISSPNGSKIQWMRKTQSTRLPTHYRQASPLYLMCILDLSRRVQRRQTA